MDQLPSEIILQIVSNITNIYDIKSLLDVYCNNEELVFNIKFYVSHLDIMKQDRSMISYDDYLDIKDMFVLFPNLKTYNLHLNFNKHYDEVDSIHKFKCKEENWNNICKYYNSKLQENIKITDKEREENKHILVNIMSKFTHDIVIIFQDKRLINYDIAVGKEFGSYDYYHNFINFFILNVIKHHKKQGYMFYHTIRSLISYNNGVYYDNVGGYSLSMIDSIKHIGIHTLIDSNTILGYLPVTKISSNNLGSILSMLKLNKRTYEPYGTITNVTRVVHCDDTYGEVELNCDRDIIDINSIHDNIYYLNVTIFSRPVPSSKLRLLYTIFPNVKVWTVYKHDTNESDIEKFRNTYPGTVVDIVIE